MQAPASWQSFSDHRLPTDTREQEMTQDVGPNESSAGVVAPRYDIVVVGGGAGGLSVAVSSQRSGLPLVRLIEPGDDVAFTEIASENRLDVGYGEELVSIDTVPDGDDLVVTTNRLAYRARACVVAVRPADLAATPPIPVAPSLETATGSNSRVHIDAVPDDVDDLDVLVVGTTDHAVEVAAELNRNGARVVIAGGGMDPAKLSPAAEHMIRRLERERKLTVLYRSMPDQIGDDNSFPMAYFDDRRTPDLQFDHVVFATRRQTMTQAGAAITDQAAATGRVWILGDPSDDGTDSVPMAPGSDIGIRIAEAAFPDLELTQPLSSVRRRARNESALEELRQEHYNATITEFEPTHSDLWVLRVEPDSGGTSYLPGQYASLGLGFWEDRIDEATDNDLDKRWDKLIRRSYSISNRMFDDHGYLANQSDEGSLEFYIVLVRPSETNVPALTPRLALKRPGDRIYLGPKVAGRYTLGHVDDPNATIVFLSTGTGEAPHNGMIVELLRKGHVGSIVSAVSVRQWSDLGYSDKHRQLEARYPNYHYLPLPTRESDVPKQYIQDAIANDVFSSEFGVDLDPANTHVFLCGNPSMIGLPEGEGDEPEFPETTGVVEILTKRGFKLDRRNSPGNMHYEEYW